MTYDEIEKQSEMLSYRDKLRLAQVLIQIARKEEEDHAPEQRQTSDSSASDLVQYVAERVMKLRPARVNSLLNTIGAMFQFQGGISDDDKNIIISELQKQSRIIIDQSGRVSYPSTEMV